MNAIIEIIHKGLGNLVRTYNIQETYVDAAEPWTMILSASAFVVLSTYHTTKGNSTGQLVFGPDMIPPIYHVAYWIYTQKSKQAQIKICNPLKLY